MSRAVARQNDDEPKQTIVEANSEAVTEVARIVSFRGRPMLLQPEPYAHFTPLTKTKFEQIAYPLLGGVTRSRILDVFAYVSATAEDLTAQEDLVLFGLTTLDDAGQSTNRAAHAVTRVWDMDSLSWRDDVAPAGTIWRSPYAVTTSPDPTIPRGPVPFVMDLAGGRPDVYDDIMQSIAPMIMKRKPDGAIWWVGDGANGKSTLMDAIHKIFPGQLSSMTVKQLTDARDTPSLNGTLANIVKESSEGRIDDTEIYKAIGTHEDFWVHKFHSQDSLCIRGNVHHIFSANTIPVFNDKGHSARRRTFIVPFQQQFASDPTFEARTFTPEMFGHLIFEMTRYAVRLRKQGYKYKWSVDAQTAKTEYDTSVNNAEEFIRELVHQGVVCFLDFTALGREYQNYCSENGYVPLGVNQLRKAVKSAGFDRSSFRNGTLVGKHYRLPDTPPTDLIPYSLGQPGLYTVPGFVPAEDPTLEPTQTPDVPPEEPPEPPKPRFLKGGW